MEFKRNSVIALFLAGKSQSAIVQELQHLNVNKMFVYRTIERYKETGSIKVQQGRGSHKTATSSERLQQNPAQSGNQMAKELNISDRIVSDAYSKMLSMSSPTRRWSCLSSPMTRKKSGPKEPRSWSVGTRSAIFRRLTARLIFHPITTFKPTMKMIMTHHCNDFQTLKIRAMILVLSTAKVEIG